jgi:hypothetical protein
MHHSIALLVEGRQDDPGTVRAVDVPSRYDFPTLAYKVARVPQLKRNLF